MSREELIKILEDYEIFVDDDFGGSYKSIIAYTPDKKVSRAHTPIGTLKIIDTFEEIQNQNKKYKEVINKLRELIGKHYFKQSDDYYDYFTEGVCLQDGDYQELEDILKEVE